MRTRGARAGRGVWGAAVLALALAGCTALGDITGEREARRIREVGTAAEALVLAIRDTGMTINDDPVVAFTLEVRPSGGVPYQAETRARIGRLDIPQIQPGAVLPVAVDPADRHKVALRLYRDR